MISSQANHEQVVQLLLAHQADTNQARAGDGSTALIMAAQCGHVDIVGQVRVSVRTGVGVRCECLYSTEVGLCRNADAEASCV